jgi:hypothetical protein
MLPPPLRGLSVAALLSVACQEAPPAPLETPGAGAPPDADAATLTIPLAPPSSARPLPRFRHRCEDQRYPALAGPWLLGCGPGGKLDLAEHVRTGQVVALDSAASSAGLAEGSLFAVGRDHGLWTLPDPAPQQPATMVSHPPIAPPALQGPGVAVLSEGRVTLFLTGSAQMLSRPAHPLPWFPPALVWPEVYWVDAGQQERSGLDIWAWTHGAGPPRPVVADPGDQRHVAASSRWLGWLDDRGVWLRDHDSGQRWHHACDTGFRAGLSIDGAVACWEERNEGDIDVRCSDGLEARGEGDQGWPSRWGDWLLVRRDGMPWLIHREPTADGEPA